MQTNSCLRFVTYLENDFSFFRKSLKLLWPQLLFLEACCKYGKKNPKHIPSLTILRFQEKK